jgi:hypothetical protein
VNSRRRFAILRSFFADTRRNHVLPHRNHEKPGRIVELIWEEAGKIIVIHWLAIAELPSINMYF